MRRGRGLRRGLGFGLGLGLGFGLGLRLGFGIGLGFGLGLVLYVLANRNCEPFIDTQKQMPSYGELQDAFEKRINGEPLPPPVDASPALAKVLLKACAYKPSARYRNAAEFRAALLPLAKEPRRFQIWWAALAAALVVLAVASAKWIVPRLTRGAQPPQAIEATSAPTQAAGDASSARSIRDCIPAQYTPAEGEDNTFLELRETPSGEMFAYNQIILHSEEAVSSTDAIGEVLARYMPWDKYINVEKTRTLRQEDPSVWVKQGKWTDDEEQIWRCEAGAIYNADAGQLQPAMLMVFEAQEQEYIDAAFDSFEAMLLEVAGG